MTLVQPTDYPRFVYGPRRRLEILTCHREGRNFVFKCYQDQLHLTGGWCSRKQVRFAFEGRHLQRSLREFAKAYAEAKF